MKAALFADRLILVAPHPARRLERGQAPPVGRGLREARDVTRRLRQLFALLCRRLLVGLRDAEAHLRVEAVNLHLCLHLEVLLLHLHLKTLHLQVGDHLFLVEYLRGGLVGETLVVLRLRKPLLLHKEVVVRALLSLPRCGSA
jgi:hypothetical protein